MIDLDLIAEAIRADRIRITDHADEEAVVPLPLTDLLTELKSRLMALYGVRLKDVCLYGSYARGEQQSESDVDVLIIVDRVDRYSLEIERTSHLIAELSLKYRLSISRIFVSEGDWKNRDTPFLENAREEAILA